MWYSSVHSSIDQLFARSGAVLAFALPWGLGLVSCSMRLGSGVPRALGPTRPSRAARNRPRGTRRLPLDIRMAVEPGAIRKERRKR